MKKNIKLLTALFGFMVLNNASASLNCNNEAAQEDQNGYNSEIFYIAAEEYNDFMASRFEKLLSKLNNDNFSDVTIQRTIRQKSLISFNTLIQTALEFNIAPDKRAMFLKKFYPLTYDLFDNYKIILLNYLNISTKIDIFWDKFYKIVNAINPDDNFKEKDTNFTTYVSFWETTDNKQKYEKKIKTIKYYCKKFLTILHECLPTHENKPTKIENIFNDLYKLLWDTGLNIDTEDNYNCLEPFCLAYINLIEIFASITVYTEQYIDENEMFSSFFNETANNVSKIKNSITNTPKKDKIKKLKEDLEINPGK